MITSDDRCNCVKSAVVSGAWEDWLQGLLALSGNAVGWTIAARTVVAFLLS